MKKILVLVFVLFMVLTHKSSAQDGCTINCNWSSVQTVNVTIGNCSYTANYQYSVCQGICYFKLIDLDNIGIDCFNNYTMKELVRAAQKAIVELPWVTCAEEGGCIKAITGYASSCWKWDGLIGPANPTVSLIPCNINSCCTYNWNICNGIATLIHVENGTPCYPLPQDCFEVCE